MIIKNLDSISPHCIDLEKDKEKFSDNYFNPISILDLNNNPQLAEVMRRKNSSSNIKNYHRSLNIIICDDELVMRQSLSRIFLNISQDLKVRINVIEAKDGIECIYAVYKCLLKGIKIDMIFCDENMNYINGTNTAHLIKEICEKKKYINIKFYLIASVEEYSLHDVDISAITKLINKPLDKQLALKLVKDNNILY
jgi:CheY-like chemotaxis protein